MQTTGNQDRLFRQMLFESFDEYGILEKIKEQFESDSSWVLDWITNNFEPDDVFAAAELSKWAEANGYVKE